MKRFALLRKSTNLCWYQIQKDLCIMNKRTSCLSCQTSIRSYKQLCKWAWGRLKIPTKNSMVSKIKRDLLVF